MEGSEDTYLLSMVGFFLLHEFILKKKKKIHQKPNLCSFAYTKPLYFFQVRTRSWPTVGTGRKHWEASTKGNICYYCPKWIHSGNEKHAHKHHGPTSSSTLQIGSFDIKTIPSVKGFTMSLPVAAGDGIRWPRGPSLVQRSNFQHC